MTNTLELAESLHASMPGCTEIRVQAVQKSFGDNGVLNGMELEIEKGEMVAVVGRSGCGKTVLLNLILGLMKPDSGDVWVADNKTNGAPLVDVTQFEDAIGIARIQTHWGVVFQSNALFSGSVFENLALWLREVKNLDPGAITEIARAVLGSVDLPITPKFLDSDAASLSGGMAKRLAIACALSMDPVVLFYDEPTTGLDPVTAIEIQELILTTHQGGQQSDGAITTIIITHDKDLLSRLGPRTVMLHEGRVYFDGSFEDFRGASSEIIRPYFASMPTLHGRAPDFH
jgi:phospholipid/cholesterol/gamma-HCH transport system ATP-binding protein